MTGTASAKDIEWGMDVIDCNARAQVRLIEDLLDFSRIMAGGYDSMCSTFP